MTTWTLGNSLDRRKLSCEVFGPAGMRCPAAPAQADWPWLLFLSGVHGDEIEGIWLMDELLERFCAAYPGRVVGSVVWARANPDGTERHQRWNARHIDLNRNLPTKDWTAKVDNPRYLPGESAASEPETRALVTLIETCKPLAILSAHSYEHYQVNSNGPARAWAEELAKVCGYPVTEDIGYPTPGSLGTFAGSERHIPTITLEIRRGLNREEVLKQHVPVALRALEYWDQLKAGERT